MLPKSVIDAYVGRDLESFDWVKELPDAELDLELEDLGVETDSLWRHQKETILIGSYRPYLAIYHQMGLGKTKTALEICAHHAMQTLLVLVPYIIQKLSWESELRKWEPLFHVEVMTYAAFRNLCKAEGTDALMDRWTGSVVDESNLIGNRKSQIFRCIYEVSENHKVRLALSGTPFGRDPSLLWSQIKYVDRGKTFGDWKMFREAFCKLVGEPKWQNFVLNKERKDDLHRMLDGCSIRRATEVCLDMPDKVYQRLEYEMPNKAWLEYSALLKKIREAKKLKALGGQAQEVYFNRLWQLTSGFQYVDDGEERGILDYGLDKRVDALLHVIEGLDEEPYLVFCHFQASRAALIKGMKKAKISFTESPTNWQRGSKQCLLLSATSGSYGGNFQRANKVFFFETSTSPMVRDQAEARIWRGGQNRTCFIYDVVCNKGMDKHILALLKEGKDAVNHLFGIIEHQH